MYNHFKFNSDTKFFDAPGNTNDLSHYHRFFTKILVDIPISLKSFQRCTRLRLKCRRIQAFTSTHSQIPVGYAIFVIILCTIHDYVKNYSLRTLCGTAQTCKSLSGAQRTEMRGEGKWCTEERGRGVCGSLAARRSTSTVAQRSNKWTARVWGYAARGVSRWGGGHLGTPSRTKRAPDAHAPVFSFVCRTPVSTKRQEGQMSLITVIRFTYKQLNDSKTL